MSYNTLIHRVARPLVRPLAATAVTPNHVTTLRLVTGIAAAALLAVGQTPWQHVGAGVFLLSILLDRADGELARLSGKSSPFGHTYDLVADSLSNVLLFLGLGIGLRDGAFGAWAILLGSAAGLAIASILWLMMRAESAAGQRSAHLTMIPSFDPDDAMVVVPILICYTHLDRLVRAVDGGRPGRRIRVRGLLLLAFSALPTTRRRHGGLR